MEQLTFDSRGMSGADGYDSYEALYRVGTDVTQTEGGFVATVAARRYPRLLVFDRSLAGVSHERTRQRIENDGFDHAVVQLVLSGYLAVETGDHRRWVGPGEMVAFDMRRPQRTFTDGARYLTLSFTRDLLAQQRQGAAGFHGRVYPTGAATIVLDHVRRLAASPPELAAAEAVTSLLALDLGALLGAGPMASRAAAAAEINIRKAMRYMLENIRRADLSAELIADSIGVSRSVLYRMFEAEGGVARSIKRQRLLAFRAALTQAAQDKPVSHVARDCGFVNDAHANRSFRDAYGVAPGHYRVSRRAQALDAGTARGFRHWFDDFT